MTKSIFDNPDRDPLMDYVIEISTDASPLGPSIRFYKKNNVPYGLVELTTLIKQIDYPESEQILINLEPGDGKYYSFCNMRYLQRLAKILDEENQKNGETGNDPVL